MRLSKKLLAMIEEHDIDEGEILQAVMLDPDSTDDDMESAIYDFLVQLPDYDPTYEYKTHEFIQLNLLDDDDEDEEEDEYDDDDEEDDFDEVTQREMSSWVDDEDTD